MSNMNYITYNGRVIKDEDLAIGGSATNCLMMYHGMISEELKPDTFTFYLIYDMGQLLFLVDADGKYLVDANDKFLVVRADDFDPENFRFGDTLKYYINNGSTMVGQFYVQSVTRITKKIYRFECTSGIGMTTYYGHNGGIYSGATLGTIVAEIMGNIPYTIDADLAAVTCTGWLPKVKAARDSLLALLFMSGGSVKKNANGTINFGFLGAGTVKTIQDVRLNVGAEIVNLEPATRVEVTSYEFHALNSDETVTLFDNTNGVAASSLVVDFTQPVHDLAATGSIVVSESNANYAVVTGVGTLTGKVYTQTTSVYAIDTGRKGEPNVIQVNSNCMINPGNVANVAKRISGYYGIAKEVNYLMRVSGERPGDKVTFKDPWGDQQTGFIKSMNITLSKNLNSNTVIALDWTPGPFGDSYSKYKVFRASDINNGTLTFPAEMVGAQAMIVLLGGAGGGQAGYDGEEGHHVDGTWTGTELLGKPCAGGEGGAAGQPGERGKSYSVYVNALPASYSNAAIGAGGAGGASNGALGSAGGATTLDSWSSANGVQLIDDYTNMLDGTAYGTLNVAGEAGSAGGIGAGYGDYSLDTSTKGSNHTNEDGTVNYGGNYANGVYFIENHRTYRVAGAGGGGAAHGADGSDGIGGARTPVVIDEATGGAGADAVAPLQAAETQAGRGGHGGGGGGGASASYSKGSSQTGYSYNRGTGGAGGAGSAGGQGGDGLIIVYYNPA